VGAQAVRQRLLQRGLVPGRVAGRPPARRVEADEPAGEVDELVPALVHTLDERALVVVERHGVERGLRATAHGGDRMRGRRRRAVRGRSASASRSTSDDVAADPLEQGRPAALVVA
jgi:hypothetical protein